MSDESSPTKDVLSPPGETGNAPRVKPGLDYQEEEKDPMFIELKRRHRSFVFPLTVFFLVWYFTYVILAAYAHDFMATPVFGVINVGLLLGFGQFITTFAITMTYVSFANRRLDPLAAQIREDLAAKESAA
ncbi:DUF485 domain-containing protein [Salinibacterium sp. NSLL150]|uniref:DUF485 domain-containing protein n=2 Tax=Salinibacterium TaxID=235888 RepID=UPI0018CEB828|nr:DUF485 domain-containing protein [Salinibacterium sp. NSLL35]MBH0101238.1 DUF485 domain-containing protein [Salinibacterium sp. NSLL150]MBH0103997.1 DUF485 domain-containing protein [Salinibacterium sp. NSLL16]MBH0106758.1 DUF485 domain-containing protein [Salinibacterium sp. NSLL17]